MATNIRIVHARDFILATPEGKIDFAKSKQLLVEIASASTPLTNYEIILDTRKAQIALSVAELWYLAAELSNLGKAFLRKTAVLCPVERFDQAGFFALCAQNRGFQVRAFLTLDDAIEWLTTGVT